MVLFGFVVGIRIKRKVFKLEILRNSMFGWLFGGKKEVEKLKEDVKHSFNSVKNDINSVGEWIKHLDHADKQLQEDVKRIFHKLSSIESQIDEIKNNISLIDKEAFKQVFKTAGRLKSKQTAVQGVQKGVQTAVQTGVLSNFSVMERALIYILLNSDMKLSYDDLAAMMGKTRATVRGQVNAIKQKSEGLISEIIEQNGKKRLFIPENIKEKLVKSAKVRVNISKKSGKK